MDRSIYDNIDTWGFFSEFSENVPGFHALVRDHKPLPQHDYFWHRFDGRQIRNPTSPYVSSVRNNANWFPDAVWNGFVVNAFGGASAPCPSLSELRNSVQNRLLSKVRNSSIDLGVALGEYSETASFVSNAMYKVAKSYKQLRRGNASGAVRTLIGKKGEAGFRPGNADQISDVVAASSSAWLAYTYGLTPLVNDVNDAVTAYARSRRPYPLVRIVRSRKDRQFFVKAPTYVDGPLKIDSAVGANLSVSGCVAFYVTNPLVKTLDECGLVNPLSVAWELVPFSFVVDWFVPVGAYLQGIVPPQGVDFLYGWISEKASGGSFGSSSAPDGSLSAVGNNVIKKRTILHDFPRYHLVVPDLSLSKGQIASGLALMAQQAVRDSPRVYWTGPTRAFR